MANAARQRHFFPVFWPTVCSANVMSVGRAFCRFTSNKRAIKMRRDRGMWEQGGTWVDESGGGGVDE